MVDNRTYKNLRLGYSKNKPICPLIEERSGRRWRMKADRDRQFLGTGGEYPASAAVPIAAPVRAAHERLATTVPTLLGVAVNYARAQP